MRGMCALSLLRLWCTAAKELFLFILASFLRTASNMRASAWQTGTTFIFLLACGCSLLFYGSSVKALTCQHVHHKWKWTSNTAAMWTLCVRCKWGLRNTLELASPNIWNCTGWHKKLLKSWNKITLKNCLHAIIWLCTKYVTSPFLDHSEVVGPFGSTYSGKGCVELNSAN